MKDLDSVRKHPEFVEKVKGFRDFVDSAQAAIYEVVEVKVREE